MVTKPEKVQMEIKISAKSKFIFRIRADEKIKFNNLSFTQISYHDFYSMFKSSWVLQQVLTWTNLEWSSNFITKFFMSIK